MAFEKVVLLHFSVVARDFENRLWDRNLQFLEDLSDTLVHFVASKESILAGYELDGLKLSKSASDKGPRFPAGQLGRSLDQKRKGADLHVRFYPARQPVIDRSEVNLRAFEGSETARSMIMRFLYPQAASSILRVSSLVMRTHLPSYFSASLTLAVSR